MDIICVDPSPISLVRLWMKIKKIYPDADVKCCSSSEKALEAARKIKDRRTSEGISPNANCHILITDVDLGGSKGDGLQLAEEIKKLYSNINIIFVSGDLDRNYAGQILKMRPSGYLAKPFSMEELKEELCNLRYMPSMVPPDTTI